MLRQIWLSAFPPARTPEVFWLAHVIIGGRAP